MTLVEPSTHSLQHLAELSIVDTDVEELILPKNISIIDGTAICNNRNLKKIVIEGDISDIITENTFIPTRWRWSEVFRNFPYCCRDVYTIRKVH